MENLTTTNHTPIFIQNLSHTNLLSLEYFHTTEINYILDFLKNHKITKLSLNDAKFITFMLFDHNSDNINILKLIIALTYIKFNNLPLTTTEFISLINKLNINKNLSFSEVFNNQTGEFLYNLYYL